MKPKTALLFIYAILFGSNLWAQGNFNENDAEDKPMCRVNDSLSVFSKRESRLEAYGREETGNVDESGHCENRPFKTQGKFSQRGFFIWIDTGEIFIGRDSFLCHPLYMVNNTDSMLSFMTTTDRLYLLAEAINKQGEWEELEYTPTAYCGNSYYKIYLDTNEYWRFEIPVFHGPVKTRLRYSMTFDDVIISNEIPVCLNEEQFDKPASMSYNHAILPQRLPSNLNQHAVVSTVGLNIVYFDIDNYLSIAVPGYKNNQIKVENSVGKLTHTGEESDYIFRIGKNEGNSRLLLITVSVHKLFGWEIVSRHEFRIRPIPKPLIMFGDIEQSGTYSKGKLKLVDFVACPLPDFPLEGFIYKPLRYQVFYIDKKRNPTLFEGEGSKIKPDLKKALRRCQSGDQFVLNLLSAIGPTGEIKLYQSLVIMVE